jgi:hypothetical protein
VFVYDSALKEEVPFVKTSLIQPSRSTYTDINGYLRFDSLPAGKHRLHLDFVGYYCPDTSITTQGGKSTFLILFMKPATIRLRIPEDPDPKPPVPTHYDSLLHKADSCLAKKKYGLAQNYYFHAGSQQPGSSYWLARIRECGRLQDPPVDDYTQLIRIGDSYFPEKQAAPSSIPKNTLLAAKTCYEMALKLKPLEKYPEEQLNKLNELLRKK